MQRFGHLGVNARLANSEVPRWGLKAQGGGREGSGKESKDKSFGGVYLADFREARPWLLELYMIGFVFIDASSAPKIYSFRDN